MCQKAFEGNDLFLAAEAARDSCADDCKRGKKKKKISQMVFFQLGKLVKSHLSLTADKT